MLRNKLLFLIATVAILVVAAMVTATVSAQGVESRADRLIRLNEIYKSQGWQAWMWASGAEFETGAVEARQPEQDIVYDGKGEAHVVVAGLQVRAKGLKVRWPAVVTTDRPAEIQRTGDTRQYQPDLKDPSVLYTNVVLNGQGTYWADASNWGQLIPSGGAPPQPTAVSAPPPTPAAPASTPTPPTAPPTQLGIDPFLALLTTNGGVCCCCCPSLVLAIVVGILIWYLIFRKKPAAGNP